MPTQLKAGTSAFQQQEMAFVKDPGIYLAQVDARKASHTIFLFYREPEIWQLTYLQGLPRPKFCFILSLWMEK